jgi:NitT/TauT family transport system permease protein
MALDLNSRDTAQESEIRGLDALDLGSSAPPRGHALWRAAWPKLAALAIALGLWQLVAISGWRPS